MTQTISRSWPLLTGLLICESLNIEILDVYVNMSKGLITDFSP